MAGNGTDLVDLPGNINNSGPAPDDISCFFYLATPYSRHPRGHDTAHREACEAAAICIRAGLHVFSPIAHTHAIARVGDFAGHFEQWAAFDKAMIAASAGIIVVTMDGWTDSAGIAAEIAYCRSLGLPVVYMAPAGPAPVGEVDSAWEHISKPVRRVVARALAKARRRLVER